MRLVELGESRAVSFAGKLLADLGAEVWMVERPGRGNGLRYRRPLLPGGRSGLFEFLAKGKKSIGLDIDTDDGGDLAARFIAKADGVIAEGVSWERLRDRGPWLESDSFALATVSSRGMPQSAGNQDSEFVDFHVGGGGYMTPGRVGDPRKEYPMELGGGGQASYVAGLNTAMALLASLAATDFCGRTVRNDVSVQAAMASMMALNVPWVHYAGQVPSRLRSANRPTRAGGGFVRVADGRVTIQLVEEHQWDRLVQILGEPEWTKLPIFATQLERSANWDVICGFLEGHFRERTMAEVMALCQAERIPAFAVRTMEGVLASEHEKARGFFVRTPGSGEVLLPRNPWIVDGKPVDGGPEAPEVGAHTLEGLEGLGLSAEDFCIFQELGVAG